METAFCLCSGVVLGNNIQIKIAAVVVVLTWPKMSSRVSLSVRNTVLLSELRKDTHPSETGETEREDPDG